VKTVHSVMSRNVPKVAHSVFDGTELNAPLPPLAAHVVSPDGTHEESMCKTDQPPYQLMRPRRINNRVETDTYLVCIGFRMTNT